MEKLTLQVDQKEVTVLVEKIQNVLWIKMNDEIWSVPVADLSSEGQRRKKSATASPDIILAPMPGKVTKVFVKVGDSVEVGQALLVMEAMKMEYTLKSDLKTKVEKVNIQLNDQVQLGSVLIKLETQNDKAHAEKV